MLSISPVVRRATTRFSLNVRLAVVAAALLLFVGCTHETDIVVTNSEDTGNYHVTSSRLQGDVLLASVCVDNPRFAAEIADRVIHQVVNHGYGRIELRVGSRGGPTDTYVWTASGAEKYQAGTPGPNPCATPSG